MKVRGIGLKVPAFSQNIHSGQPSRYDGGGEAWCYELDGAKYAASCS